MQFQRGATGPQSKTFMIKKVPTFVPMVIIRILPLKCAPYTVKAEACSPGGLGV